MWRMVGDRGVGVGNMILTDSSRAARHDQEQKCISRFIMRICDSNND